MLYVCNSTKEVANKQNNILNNENSIYKGTICLNVHVLLHEACSTTEYIMQPS